MITSKDGCDDKLILCLMNMHKGECEDFIMRVAIVTVVHLESIRKDKSNLKSMHFLGALYFPMFKTDFAKAKQILHHRTKFCEQPVDLCRPGTF